MLGTRQLLLIIIVAQIIAMSVGSFAHQVNSAIMEPLTTYIFGGVGLDYNVGPFDITAIVRLVGGFISTIVTILLALLVLRIVFRFFGSWIMASLPPDAKRGEIDPSKLTLRHPSPPRGDDRPSGR